MWDAVWDIGLLTEGKSPFEEGDGTVESPLAEIQGGETAARLIQTEDVAGSFGELYGLVPIAAAVGKLAKLRQGLDQTVPDDHGRERGSEACLRWELCEGIERLCKERDCCVIRPQVVVRITQVELGGHPQHHISVSKARARWP